MSYVRWSSDDFKSDIYAYASNSGFETWVASNRIAYVEELPPPVEVDWQNDKLVEEYFKRDEKVMDIIDKSPHFPIGLPYDGQHFVDDTEEEMVNTWIMLKEAGYNIPEGLIEDTLDYVYGRKE